MGYHDRDLFTRKWSKPEETKVESENPRMQIISPQKKLYDIQKILNDAREAAPSMYELHTAIQTILDGE